MHAATALNSEVGNILTSAVDVFNYACSTNLQEIAIEEEKEYFLSLRKSVFDCLGGIVAGLAEIKDTQALNSHIDSILS